VAYSTGGVPDWLIDGETGFLVTPGNITQLGDRLQKLLESPELCQQMGERAQRMALRQWSAAKHIEQLLEEFGTAVDHGAKV
jgi:glycosyltransferase involved in cell wall biosynthesis